MRVHVSAMTEVVQKLFGKTFEEAAKQLYPGLDQDKSNARRWPWGVHVIDNPNDGSVTVNVGFKNYAMLLSFTLSQYPSCCGSRMFHTFKVDEQRVSQAQLDEIMSAFVKENRGMDALGTCNRIEVVMVEQRHTKDGGYVYNTAMEEPEPVEDPRIRYKTLWNFFHKHGKRVRTRLEVNDNTRNVLHNMEVIL